MGNEQKISINKLHLHLNNPRCLFVETEEDALYELLIDQGGNKRTNKIIPLAKSIAKNGWSPTEILIVTPNDTDGEYTVMEGNRRLAALRCLDSPNLLPDSFAIVRAEFEKLSPPLISFVRCYVTDDQDEINELIERRHNGQNGGAGIIPWNTEQRARFIERSSGKKDKIVRLIEYLHSIFSKGSQEEVWLSEINKTSLARLFSTPYVRERLGFELVNSIYVASSPDLKVLSRFLKRLSKTSVGDIYTAQDRRVFIDAIMKEFEDNSLEKAPQIDFGGRNAEAHGSEHKNELSNSTGPYPSSAGVEHEAGDNVPRPKGYPFNRRTVAPREGSPLPTQGEANLAQIHYELKTLDANEAPIACSLLLRSLITLSTDAYLRAKLKITEYEQLKPGYSSRIQRACKELVNDSMSGLENNDVDYMRKFAQNKDDLPVTLSSLHSSAHGSNGWPSGKALIALWDKTYKVIREMLSYTQSQCEMN